MTARAATPLRIAAFVVIVAAAATAWFALQPAGAPKRGAADATASVETPAPEPAAPAQSVVLGWDRDTGPAGSTSVDDAAALDRAYQAGVAYAQRWQAATDRQRLRRFGPEIAALMRLPLEQAWPALEARLLEGDAVAADALRDIQCPTSVREADGGALAQDLSRDLDPRAAAFVRGAIEREEALRVDTETRCLAHGLGDARLAALARRRLGAIAPGDLNDRALFALAWPESQPDSPVVPSRYDHLVQRIGDSELPLETEDWITLIAAADLEPQVAYALGECVRAESSCQGIADPQERRQLLERASGAGNTQANATLVDQLAADDPAAAYAWALYQRWVLVSGCSPVSGVYEFSRVAATIARLERELTPQQRAQAIQQANGLIARYGSAMYAAFGCTG